MARPAAAGPDRAPSPGRRARRRRRPGLVVPAWQADVGRLAIGGRDRLEVLVDDLHRHRRGDVAAVAAVLDQHRQGDPRAARRREADEPGVVARLVAAELAAWRPCDLRRAGLARHLRSRRAGLVGRPLLSLTTPTSAWRTTARFSGATEISRRTRGGELFQHLPVGRFDRARRSEAARACRRWRWPRTCSAICSSVTRVDPCPMTAFSDCPIWKPSALGFWRFCSRYHSSVGRKPPSSPLSPSPVGAPSPRSVPNLASRSIIPGRAPARRSRRCSSARWRRRG